MYRYLITLRALNDGAGETSPAASVTFEAHHREDIVGMVERIRQVDQLDVDKAASLAVGLRLLSGAMGTAKLLAKALDAAQ